MAKASEMSHHPKGKGCWYFTYTRACPLCGKEATERTRRWDEKPADISERFEYFEMWDWCNAL